MQVPVSRESAAASPQYPWSKQEVILAPITKSPRREAKPKKPLKLSPSPFPRHGHSIAGGGSAHDTIYLFGGVVNGELRNDVYAFSPHDMSLSSVETTGNMPPPRHGHGSALIGKVLFVWGGKTDQRGNEDDGEQKLDSDLYLLNCGRKLRLWV